MENSETLNTDAVEDICPPTLLETVRVRGVNAKEIELNHQEQQHFSSFLSIPTYERYLLQVMQTLQQFLR